MVGMFVWTPGLGNLPWRHPQWVGFGSAVVDMLGEIELKSQKSKYCKYWIEQSRIYILRTIVKKMVFSSNLGDLKAYFKTLNFIHSFLIKFLLDFYNCLYTLLRLDRVSLYLIWLHQISTITLKVREHF